VRPRPLPSKRAPRAASEPARAGSGGDLLDDLPFWVTRTFYNYLAFLERKLAESGLDEHLRPGMGPVMFALASRDDLLIKELAERIRVAPSTLTGTLAAMEKADLIARRTDEADARASRIRLTRRGRSLMPRLHAFHEQLVASMCESLDSRQVDTLRDLLARLNATLRG
jgi:DNA-binding MarR family transcriptional regulator